MRMEPALLERLCCAEQRVCAVQLGDLYENDCIFDKFDCCFSGDGSHVATGTYSNCFRVISRGEAAGSAPASDIALEASRDPQRKRLQQTPSKACHPRQPDCLLSCRSLQSSLLLLVLMLQTVGPGRLLRACNTHAPESLVLIGHHMMAHYGSPCTCEVGVLC